MTFLDQLIVHHAGRALEVADLVKVRQYLKLPYLKGEDGLVALLAHLGHGGFAVVLRIGVIVVEIASISA